MSHPRNFLLPAIFCCCYDLLRCKYKGKEERIVSSATCFPSLEKLIFYIMLHIYAYDSSVFMHKD